MTTFVNIVVQVEIPDDSGIALDLSQQVLAEIAHRGIDLRDLPEAHASTDFNDPDTGEFDISEYAFFILANRHLSETAENQVAMVDYDTMDLP